MKTLYKIFLVFLLAFLASTYFFQLSPVDYSNSISVPEIEETPDNNIKLVSEEGTTLTDPDTISILHTAESENDITISTDYIFTVDVYKDDHLILTNLTDLETVSIHFSNGTALISKTNPMKTTLDISQNRLGLESGNYTIVLNSTINEMKENNKSITLNVTYSKDAIYIPASNTTPENKIGITLYFTDKDINIEYSSLIPVTRFVDYDKSLNKKVIDELQKGPIIENMVKTIGEVRYTVLQDQVIYIDIPESDTTYTSGSAGSSISYFSLVKSMFSLQKYIDFTRLRFTINDFPKETYFHGRDVEYSFEYSFNNKGYLAFKLDDRYYLSDFDVHNIEANDSVEIIAEKLFNFMKDNDVLNIVNPIPKNVTLQNISFSNRTLTIDFNDSFLISYENRDDLKRMMLDALVYSFTSIQSVDSIIITVNNDSISDFAGVDLSVPIYPPKYINLEEMDI